MRRKQRRNPSSILNSHGDICAKKIQRNFQNAVYDGKNW